LTDFATELGLKLLPILTPLLAMVGRMADAAMPLLADAFDRMMPILQSFVDFILTIEANIGGNIEKFGAFEGIIRTVGDALGFSKDEIDKFVEVIDKFVEAINTVITDVQKVIQPIADWVAENVTLNDVLIAAGVLLAGIVIPAIWSLVAAFLAVAVPIMLVIAAVALLRTAWEEDFLGIRTAVQTWAEENGGYAAAVMGWWEDVKTAASQLAIIFVIKMQAASVAAQQLSALVGIAMGEIKAWWEDVKTAATQLALIVGAKFGELQAAVDSAMAGIGSKVAEVKGIWDGFVGAVKDFWNWISGKNFSIDISLPQLPPWAIPGSPLPSHTAWKAFASDMNAMVISPRMDMSEMVGVGDMGGETQNISYTANTTINTNQDPLRVLNAARHLDALGAMI
jgi:hypothetical protein